VKVTKIEEIVENMLRIRNYREGTGWWRGCRQRTPRVIVDFARRRESEGDFCSV
jgi:hypothetical protein